MSVFSTIKHDRILLFGFALCGIGIVISFLAIALFYHTVPPFLPLFNQLPASDARLGTKPQILIPPAIVLILSFLNLILAHKLYSKIPLLSRIFAITSLLIAFFAFFFLIHTLMLIL